MPEPPVMRYNPDDIIDPERLARQCEREGLTLTAEMWREACEIHVAKGMLIRLPGGRYAPADMRHQWN